MKTLRCCTEGFTLVKAWYGVLHCTRLVGGQLIKYIDVTTASSNRKSGIYFSFIILCAISTMVRFFPFHNDVLLWGIGCSQLPQYSFLLTVFLNCTTCEFPSPINLQALQFLSQLSLYLLLKFDKLLKGLRLVLDEVDPVVYGVIIYK